MSAVKRRHTVLTVEQKIDICKQLKKGASIMSVSKDLGVGKSTICDIKKSEDELMEFVSKMEHAEVS
jgi:IS30 family transposase